MLIEVSDQCDQIGLFEVFALSEMQCDQIGKFIAVGQLLRVVGVSFLAILVPFAFYLWPDLGNSITWGQTFK